MTHLWESNHPYYSTEGNYFSNDCHARYESWHDFYDDQGNDDIDLNLVYRWDWREGEDWEIPQGKARLMLYFVGQRKALHRSAEIEVSRGDEEQILAYLRPRFARLIENWLPILLPAAESPEKER